MSEARVHLIPCSSFLKVGGHSAYTSSCALCSRVVVRMRPA